METRYEILELARFLTELSVIDYFFVVYRSSDVAVAALLNSMETVTVSSDVAISGLEQELSRVNGGLDPKKAEVQECRARLHILYAQGGYSRPEIIGREPRDETVSPVCVSFGLTQPQFYPPQPSSVGEYVLELDENNNTNRPVEVESVDTIHELTKNTSALHKPLHYKNEEDSQLLDVSNE